MNAITLMADIARIMQGAKLIVVSNREPCLHEHTGGAIKAVRHTESAICCIIVRR